MQCDLDLAMISSLATIRQHFKTRGLQFHYGLMQSEWVGFQVLKIKYSLKTLIYYLLSWNKT